VYFAYAGAEECLKLPEVSWFFPVFPLAVFGTVFLNELV
jgi:hypothetical protein